MSKKLFTRIQDKYDTYDEWAKSDIKPINGELYIYASEDNSVSRLKIGDERVATVDALPFVGYVENSGLFPYPAFEELSCTLSNENDGNPVLTWKLPNNIPDSSSKLAKIIVVRDTTAIAHINQGIKIAELQPDTLTYTDTSIEVTIDTPIYYYKLFAITTKGVDNNWKENEVTAHTPTIPDVTKMWTEKDLNLIYNQEFQEPDWKRIFGAGVCNKLSIDSTQYCSAGTYEAKFKPLDGFRWDDNFSSETRSINWYIKKTTAEIHLSSDDDINFTYTSEKINGNFVSQTITFGITNSFKVKNENEVDNYDIGYQVQKYSTNDTWVDATEEGPLTLLPNTTDPYRITLSVSPKKKENKFISGKFRIRIFLGDNFVARETFINVNCKFSIADLTWEEISELAKQGQGNSFEIGDYKEVYLNGPMDTCVGDAKITFNNEKLYACIVHTTATLVYFKFFKQVSEDEIVPVAFTATYIDHNETHHGGFSLVEMTDFYEDYQSKLLYPSSIRSLITCMSGINNNLENYMIEVPTYMYLYDYFVSGGSDPTPDDDNKDEGWEGGGTNQAKVVELQKLKLFVPAYEVLKDYSYYAANSSISYNHSAPSDAVNWITCNSYPSEGSPVESNRDDPSLSYDNYQGYYNTAGTFIGELQSTPSLNLSDGSLAPIFVLGKETENNKIQVI